MGYAIRRNEEHNGIEVYFDEKPEAAVREVLKGLRMRWHNAKKCWYGKVDETAVKSAIGGEADAAPAAPAADEPNIHGIKVGDLFYTSWGYEQTNVNFFQVIALCGTQSVRVREVQPRMADERGVSGMSADRSYEVTRELLPPAHHASFINDNERGDIRRVKVSGYDSTPYFNVGIRGLYHDTARPYTGGYLYESWYA